MQRLVVTCVMTLAALMAAPSQAAEIYFRGAVTTIVGGDPLGINAFPNQNFESWLFTNNNGGILGSYIVFAGKSLQFNSGTLGNNAGNNVFQNMVLTDSNGVAAGVLNITIPGPLVADNQAAFNSLIGRLGGTMTITGVPSNPGAVYIGGITAIPEPGSMLALSGLVIGCCGYTWRKRRLAAKKAAA